jgi:predicted Mrr-cat superfamily restriction endonuclease
MTYWLHRISHHAEVSHPLLSKGYLSIGWSMFSNADFLEKVRAGDRGCFNKAYDDWGHHPRSRWSLWKYISEMKSGDLILVPSWKKFSIYRLVGDRPLISEELNVEFEDWNKVPVRKNQAGHLCRQVGEDREIVDLGFFWEVEPLHVGLSRDQYADRALTSRMKIRSTTACLNELGESVQKAIAGFSKGAPINLYSSILDNSKNQVLKMIRDDLNPDKFESLVKWYLERNGATSVKIPAKNESGKEGDADVVAVFEGIKTIIYVQAKHHRGVSSSWALDQVKDYVAHKEGLDDGYARIGWVVSSADGYTPECCDAAQEHRVILIDGDEFSRMLLEVGIANLDGAF